MSVFLWRILDLDLDPDLDLDLNPYPSCENALLLLSLFKFFTMANLNNNEYDVTDIMIQIVQ